MMKTDMKRMQGELAALLLFVAACDGLQLPKWVHAAVHAMDRRSFTSAGALIWCSTSSEGAFASTRETLLGVGDDSRCENGEGAACAALAEGNELVLRLQEKSRLNKEKNAQELYDKTVRQLGYSSFFDTLDDKNLVQLPDGKYATLDAETYARLRSQGRIDVGAIDRVDRNSLDELTQPRTASEAATN